MTNFMHQANLFHEYRVHVNSTPKFIKILSIQI